MVITCKECSTRFNLDESLLKQEGSRVRCCQCKHVFTAYPPPPLNIEDEPVQENDDLKIAQEPGADGFPLDNELDNELDLGFSTDPEMLNLDDDVDDDDDDDDDVGDDVGDVGVGDNDKNMNFDHFQQDEELNLDDPMDKEDFFLDDDLKLDNYQEIDKAQDTDLETFNIDDDLEIYEDQDQRQPKIDDDLGLENNDFDDDELELELEDYQDLTISTPETPVEQQTKDLDSNFDLELDVDLDINLEMDSQEPDLGMEVDMDSKESDLDFDLELESQESDFGMELEMDSKKSDLDFDLGMDSQEPDFDMELEMDSKKSDLDFDLELESQEPDFGMELEMELDKDSSDSKESDFDFDLEMDSPKPDPDTSISSKTIKPDEEINLSEFDEILEDEEDFLEMEIPNDDLMVIPDENGADTDDSPDRGAKKINSVVERTEKKTLSKDQDAETETPDHEPPPFLNYGMNEEFKKPVKVGKPILIILMLAILVLAGYSACIFYKIEIPYLSNINIPYLSNFLKPTPPTPVPVHLAPDKKSVNGRFVTNTTAGTLFVITGGVTNTSKAICSHIKIKGTLITKEKLKAKDKIVFCGNIIDEEQLKSLEVAEINALLVKETGNNLSNVNIKPGRSIPFMIVFSDLPENLENFTVNVEGFDREMSKN